MSGNRDRGTNCPTAYSDRAPSPDGRRSCPTRPPAENVIGWLAPSSGPPRLRVSFRLFGWLQKGLITRLLRPVYVREIEQPGQGGGRVGQERAGVR